MKKITKEKKAQYERLVANLQEDFKSSFYEPDENGMVEINKVPLKQFIGQMRGLSEIIDNDLHTPLSPYVVKK